jgi:hypothetical protein
MVVLLSMPRGRISAVRLAARRDEVEQAYGIIIRPAGMGPAREAVRDARGPRVKGGEA